ncbi:MAG: methyltransferase [bacterium]|nr:methyltransferase [bacterium]
MKIISSTLTDNIESLKALARGYWGSQALFVSLRFGLFEALAGKALTALQLSEKLRLNSDALKQLLNALVALGLLAKANENYALTSLARRCLVKGGDAYLGNLIRHQEHLLTYWLHLDEAVRTGKPPAFRMADGQKDNPERRKIFIEAMEDLGCLSAPEIYSALNLTPAANDPTKLLDVGSGPATLPRYFLKQNPDLRVTIIDLPQVTEIAKEKIAQDNLTDQITLLPGDLREIDWGSSEFDLVLLSNIIHMYDPETNRRLVKKAACALKEGGRLVIHDYVLRQEGTLPLDGVLFSLNMLIGTAGGKSYQEDEITGWLSEAGFSCPERVDLAASHSLMIGEKPSGVTRRKCGQKVRTQGIKDSRVLGGK